MSQIPAVVCLDQTNISSSSLECSPTDESSQITSLSSTITVPSNTQQQQQQNVSLSLTPSLSAKNDSFSEKMSNNCTVESVQSNNEIVDNRMDIFSCSFDNDEILNEQTNELTDKVNLSSLSYLQTKQRRIDHRRNKSEPLIRRNIQENLNQRLTILESSSTSTNSNESAISHNYSYENKTKYSKNKNNSPSTNNKQSQDKPLSISSATKKKKPWYNPFQSTYRQRHEEFRKVFKDIPNDERLIVDYSCAWQKDILIQGRMYISQSYLCFHANFLKWETSLCLKFQDIVSITREKTAKVIPNAIEIRSNKNEKYFFASFATRDKSYAIIFRIWQTILIDQPLSSQQMWNLIHQSYGNDLDMTTDDEDTYHKQSNHSTPDKTSPKQQIKNKANQSYDRVTPSSAGSKLSEKEEIEDRSSLSSHNERQTDDDHEQDDQQIIPIGEEANTDTLIRQSIPNPNPNNQQSPLTTMNFSSERKYLSKCPCQSHLSTQLIDRTYSISVERLFDYVFGDNQFLHDYHTSRRIKDYHSNQWKLNEQTGKRERICTYKVDVAAVFGSTTICSNEKQIIDCELENSHYIIDTEVRNEGIKYADTFFVASRYCLLQISPNKSHLKVTCEVRYIKSLMMIIKSFIEKNAMAALQDSYTDLNNRLELATSTTKRVDNECRLVTSNIDHENENSNKIIHKKKYSRKQQSNDFSPNIHSKHRKQNQINDQSIDENLKNINTNISSVSTSSKWSFNNLLVPFCIITMLVLVSINIFLCIKLNEIDRMTDHLIQNSPGWLNGFEYPNEDNQWSILLKRQEEYYQTKITGLHSVLISTHNALKNVTDALKELSKLSSGSSLNAPFDPISPS